MDSKLLVEKKNDVTKYTEDISYSPRYEDDNYVYRHVILPKELAKWVPKNRLMEESEWRELGVRQSPGWTHYLIHEPEPHILIFRREKDAAVKPVAEPRAQLAGGLVG